MRKMKDSGIEWIGMIPENVNILRNKYLISYVKGKLPANINTEKEGIPYIGASDLEDLSGNCTYTSYTTDTTLPLCSEEDVLILWDGARAGLIGTNHKGAVASTVVNAIPKHTINKKFWYWYLKAFQAHLYNRVNGTTIPHMNTDYIEEIAMLDWTIEDQEKIAAYLDQKCAEIDAIIAAKEKTNELLKERRQSIIYEAVTKGLDPAVSMKDSGFEWIGTIPSTWEIRKLRYLGSCSNGISKAGEFFGSGSPFVSYGDVYKNMELPREVSGLIETTAEEQQLYSVEEGDVLFTRTSETIEEVAISSTCMQTIENATFAGFLIRFRPNTELLTKEFSKYYFRSEMHRFFFVKEMNLVTRASLSQDLLKKLPVLLPPVEEQKRIASYLDNECSNIDELIATNESTIKKLKEYRQSVIYEAVTGKVEI